LQRLERTVDVSRQHAQIRMAIAKLRAIEVPDVPGRAGLAWQLICEALDGLELTAPSRDWHPELRAALSAAFGQLSIEELRSLRDGAAVDSTYPTRT
jgi:hypothetical protein